MSTTKKEKILCVTPNPAVDRTMVVPQLTPGAIHRSYEIVVDAGGKGINVARAVQALGGQPICAGFVGGLSGQRIEKLTLGEGFVNRWTQIADETRTCVIVATDDGTDATVFNENGPTVTTNECSRLQEDVLNAAADVRAVCMSGSIPTGMSVDSYQGLIERLMRAGATVYVDSNGHALRAAVEVNPTVIKINHHEIGELLGLGVHRAVDAARAAEQLLNSRIQQVVVTLGVHGAVLADADGSWWAMPPQVDCVSAVGSGDCFLAGLAYTAACGYGVQDSLQAAVACGSANTLSPGGGHFLLEDYQQIFEKSTVTMI